MTSHTSFSLTAYEQDRVRKEKKKNAISSDYSSFLTTRGSSQRAVAAAERVVRSAACSSNFTQSLVSSVLATKPEGVHGAEAFRYTYLEEEILSKYVDDDTSRLYSDEDRWNTALTALMTTETRCEELNRNGFVFTDAISPILFAKAREEIRRILGDAPPRDVLQTTGFSGGSTTSRPRSEGDPYFKYSTYKMLHVTSGSYNLAYSVIAATPVWCASGAWGLLKTVVGNDVFSVPKSALTFRLACKEPDLNGAMQKSVGDFMRKQLKAAGIDLNDQTRNQRLAEYGSLNGSLATIDSRSASNSVSRRLVTELLPYDWAVLLSRLRSPYGNIPTSYRSSETTLHEWQCHSTMGNGYTFELESLIFYALAKTTRDYVKAFLLVDDLSLGEAQHTVSVYGDDIICPSYAAPLLVRLLADLGFENNEKKTFISGPFRESCGKHFYEGVDVSPFYIRKPIDSVSRVCWFLNRLRAWAFDRTTSVCRPNIYECWLRYRKALLPTFLLGGDRLESVSCVYSPHKSRLKLARVVERMDLHGRAALLRFWQYKENPPSLSHIKWEDEGVYTENDGCSNHHIVKPKCVEVLTIRVNTSLHKYDDAYFPQEIDFL